MKFKIGTKVKLSKRLLKFYKEYSFAINQVGGVVDEDRAKEYFICKALGEKLPYMAKTINNNGMSADRVKVTIGSLSTEFYVEAKDLSKK